MPALVVPGTLTALLGSWQCLSSLWWVSWSHQRGKLIHGAALAGITRQAGTASVWKWQREIVKKPPTWSRETGWWRHWRSCCMIWPVRQLVHQFCTNFCLFPTLMPPSRKPGSSRQTRVGGGVTRMAWTRTGLIAVPQAVTPGSRCYVRTNGMSEILVSPAPWGWILPGRSTNKGCYCTWFPFPSSLSFCFLFWESLPVIQFLVTGEWRISYSERGLNL